jgi:pyruvate/2-oxoglutarate dehydrogenase complex dihydrolipoamide dehydrogenase (E3) component
LDCSAVADPQHFDILVIGSGPGGEGAAMQAVKHGKQVAVIERFKLMPRSISVDGAGGGGGEQTSE